MTRAIAILFVVFTHVHEQVGVDSYIIQAIFYDIDRLGVPLFFMLSGALVLPKIVNINMWVFYRKRIPQFIFLLFFYSFLTTFIQKAFSNIPIWQSLKESFVFTNGIYPANTGGAHHLWFMYTIIELYLIAPFLGKLLERLSNREILFFLVISIFLTQFKDSLIGGFRIEVDFIQRLGSDFLGGYLNFFVIGYLLIYRRINLSLLSSLALFLFPILFSLLRELHKSEFIGVFHWYSSSLSILLSSVGLLSLIRIAFENTQKSIFIEGISLYSFGIYLSHYIFIYIFKEIIDFSIFSFWERLIVLYIPSFVSAYIFTWLLSKNKYTKLFVM
ncbi:MAG: acyltransferase [Haemophilus parainfluenzae]|nr:acyltransferase [Haemophilus parainfluenzae]